MVNMLASSLVPSGFEPRSGKTKDYTIGIYCFSVKHVALRRKIDFYNASSLKQQSADRHVAPLGNIILIPSQPVLALSPYFLEMKHRLEGVAVLFLLITSMNIYFNSELSTIL
jgi:hypothetical protein